jgi:carboxymethylenebutenolidase
MDQGIIDLYDRFTHGAISRRAFLDRLVALAGGAAAAAALLPLLANDYARAETVPENDARLDSETLSIAEVPRLTGYFVRPKQGPKRANVIVLHENRGLNPHIRDVARRIALEGFAALAIDCLSPQGGTPADEDKARDMFAKLKPEDAVAYARAAVSVLERREDTTDDVGAVGFCWGGGGVNDLAVAESRLDAVVAYYGRQPPLDRVKEIQAPMLLHYAGLDERITSGAAAYEAALKQAGKHVEMYIYPGVNHAFNNDTAPARYNKEAADLAWSRTVAFLRKHLS